MIQALFFALTTLSLASEFPRVDADIGAYQKEIAKKTSDFNQLDVNPNNKIWVKAKLAYMYDVDQFTRNYLSIGQRENYSVSESEYFQSVFFPMWVEVDHQNTTALKELVSIWDWFTVSTFGSEADQNAWLIVQHADHDPIFQKQILTKLERLYPQDETSPANYAYLFDRVAASWQNPEARTLQRYGSQGSCIGPKQWEPLPLEEPTSVNKRRSDVGLGTLESYIQDISKLCN